MPVSKNFSVVRGDHLTFIVEFENLTTLLNTITFNVRDEANVVITKTKGAGITPTAVNKYRVTLQPSDTEVLKGDRYVYQLHIDSGFKTTPLEGVIIVSDRV